jgi:type III restriction enzyme
MKEKEKLLGFETPLKFIFSHSALREGWDNPNVFQICNFSNRETDRWRRQTIGRGLRLCVNQNGERVRGFEVNTLTVTATESFEQFAEKLQKEIEDETGIRFGLVEDHQFAGVLVQREDRRAKPMGFAESQELWGYLKETGLIDAKGRVQDGLKKALKDGTLAVPTKFEPLLPQITDILRKAAGRLEIRNADDRRAVALRKEVYLSPEFNELWDRIKYKTTYRVQFDNEKLIRTCIEAFGRRLRLPRRRYNGEEQISPSAKPEWRRPSATVPPP